MLETGRNLLGAFGEACETFLQPGIGGGLGGLVGGFSGGLGLLLGLREGLPSVEQIVGEQQCGHDQHPGFAALAGGGFDTIDSEIDLGSHCKQVILLAVLAADTVGVAVDFGL